MFAAFCMQTTLTFLQYEKMKLNYFQHSRNLFTSIKTLRKIIPTNLKGKSKSSQEWLIRQLSDPYVEKAKIENYRCRSAFKLLEINDKYHILKPGFHVIDCGASPGSWTQIAVKNTNSDKSSETHRVGSVISIDILNIHPIKGAIILSGTDFTLSSTHQKIKDILNGKSINCILSDMAPNCTGIRMLDHENITNLCYSVLRFAVLTSANGANLLVKVWDNGFVQQLEKDILRFYDHIKRIKPKASRSDSAELFILALGFKGLQK